MSTDQSYQSTGLEPRVSFHLDKKCQNFGVYGAQYGWYTAMTAPVVSVPTNNSVNSTSSVFERTSRQTNSVNDNDNNIDSISMDRHTDPDTDYMDTDSVDRPYHPHLLSGTSSKMVCTSQVKLPSSLNPDTWRYYGYSTGDVERTLKCFGFDLISLLSTLLGIRVGRVGKYLLIKKILHQTIGYHSDCVESIVHVADHIDIPPIPTIDVPMSVASVLKSSVIPVISFTNTNQVDCLVQIGERFFLPYRIRRDGCIVATRVFCTTEHCLGKTKTRIDEPDWLRFMAQVRGRDRILLSSDEVIALKGIHSAGSSTIATASARRPINLTTDYRPV
jgi:hypothetical protein